MKKNEKYHSGGKSVKCYLLALVACVAAFAGAESLEELKKEKDQYWTSIAEEYAKTCPNKSEACLFEVNLKHANQGSRVALYNVGQQLENGIGVSVDLAAAHEYYEKSALKGYYYGQMSAAVNYGKGVGTDLDLVKYAYWLEKASQQNIEPAAMIWLGTAYINGSGVDADDQKALYWFKKSLEFESAENYWKAESMFYIGWLMEAGRVEGTQQQAIEFYRSAAQLGHVGARRSLESLKRSKL